MYSRSTKNLALGRDQ